MWLMVVRSGKCHICGSTDWWFRPASELGGSGEWLCNRCHPKPASLKAGHSELTINPVGVGKLKVSATSVTVALLAFLS